MSDQEDCTSSLDPGTSTFRGGVCHNELEPTSDSKYQSPKFSGRRETNSESARSKLSSLHPLSSRSCRLLKDPLPPITRQSSILSSSSEVSIDARRHCGRLNYPVFKPPCFEHSKEKKSRKRNKDNGDGCHSDESETGSDKEKMSPPGNNSNRPGSSPINFNLLYGKESSRNLSPPKHAGHEGESDTSESNLSKASSKMDNVQGSQETFPNFRSFWDLTGMYQAGGSSNTAALQVLSLGMPQSAGGKSDADSFQNSGNLGHSARMRRREKNGGSFSTSFSQSAYTSNACSPYAVSPNAISSMSSPRSPFPVDLDTASSKSNDDEYGTKRQPALLEFKQDEKKETTSTENIEQVLESYRSVNSEMSKDNRRFSQNSFREGYEESLPSITAADSIETLMVAVDIHPEHSPSSFKSNPMVTAKSYLVNKPCVRKPLQTKGKTSIRNTTSSGQYPSSPNKIETFSTCSDLVKSLPTSVRGNVNKRAMRATVIAGTHSPKRRSLVKMSEQSLQNSSTVIAGTHSPKKRSPVKMGVQSLQCTSKPVKPLASMLTALEDPQEMKPLAQSARYGVEQSPHLSVKKPEVHSAKFPPYWPEVRMQVSSPNAQKDSSPGSLSSRSKSPSPSRCKNNPTRYPNLQSPKKIKVPNFPKSLDNSPKQPCPLTSRSLQIHKLKPSASPPQSRRRRTTSVSKPQREPSPFDLRLNLPPSPSPPPPSPRPASEEEMHVFPPDPNWVRMEPYPGCVQYCPVDKQHTHQIVVQYQDSDRQHSELSPFESSSDSKPSKKSPQPNEDEISVEPSIESNGTRYERNLQIFQKKKCNKQASVRSQPALSGRKGEYRNMPQGSKFTKLITKEEEYKLANAWFENEISETSVDHHPGTNWRDDTQFNSPASPVSVAKAFAETPAEDIPHTPSQVSNDSRERDYVLDNISLETVSENQGRCSWLGNFCRSLHIRWFSQQQN